jgi:hypothetical protein
MSKNIISHLIRSTAYGRFLYLLIALLLYLTLSPFLRNLIALRILMDVVFSCVLIAGIYAVGRKKRRSIMAAALALPLFVSVWAGYVNRLPWLTLGGNFFGILFMGYTIFVLLSFIFEEQVVTRHTIFAAVVVYLLIGLMWALVFSIMETLNPGTLVAAQGRFKDQPHLFLYYSFVTLTTLGYGDITPVDPRAGVLAVLEAIIGQIYLAVLVARLVGMHISQSRKTQGDSEFVAQKPDG